VKLVVISCWNYRDAWKPFFELLEHYWPNHPKAWLLTDRLEHIEYPEPINATIFSCGASLSWCGVLNSFLDKQNEEPILLMQEDFFFTAPVKHALVQMAQEHLRVETIGAVRLYPMPGANVPSEDQYFGKVSRGSAYRISCQASIWRPSFLSAIARQCTTPWNFETVGGPYADVHLKEDVLAYKRDVQPWPMDYLCSGISAGIWNPDSKRLCDRLGIENDWSMRRMAAV